MMISILNIESAELDAYIAYLVGGWTTPLKNVKVSWDDYSQFMEVWKVKMFMFQTTNQYINSLSSLHHFIAGKIQIFYGHVQ